MPTRLLGVLVTFNRSEDLQRTLTRLWAQTRKLDLLVVVDNGDAPDVDDLLDEYQDRGLSVRCLRPGDNLGPAGGFAMGMDFVLGTAVNDDWVVLIDDDDPPFFDNALEQTALFGLEMAGRDPTTGGVGISGGRFDVSTGRVRRIGDAEIHDAVRVDHITGGGLPMYRVGAVREVGVYNRDLFFGFEELEFGLRMTGAGHALYADGEQWRIRKATKRSQGLLPAEHESERASRTTMRVSAPSWRRYYSLRNLIYILRALDRSGAALRLAVSRGLLKPLVNLPLTPRLAWENLRVNQGAIRDGWFGRMGRTVEPYMSDGGAS